MPASPAHLPGRGAAARLPGVSISWGTAVPARDIGSGVPLLVGFVRSGSAPSRALVLDRWEDFARTVPQGAAGHLDYAVKGFFENGGRRCWVWPLALPAEASAANLRQQLLACFEAGSPLEDLAEPDLVCVPDAVLPPLGGDAASVLRVQQALLAHCQRMNDRLALLDCLPGAPHAAATPRARIPGPGSPGEADASAGACGAAYWPWINVSPLPREATAGGSTRSVPPSGHVAGVIARLDAAPGRRKAPANEPVFGAHDVDDCAAPHLLAELADEGINSLRVLPGHGVMVCGARTLSDRPLLRHIHVRRVVLGLVRWAEIGLRDLVMENQSPALWERIRQRLLGWCQARYLDGTLRGDAPAQAYYVKCDAESNPPAQRELGQVQCLVGLAISVPTEFIVIQLIQSADGAWLAG